MSQKSPLAAYIEAVLRLPPPSVRLVLDRRNDPELFVECGGCRATKPIADMPLARGELFAFRDKICFQCQKEARKDGIARIICARCAKEGKSNTVVALVHPCKDKDGFVFERGAVLHVTQCPNCAPGAEKAEIVERILWKVKNDLPVPGGSSLITTL